MKKNPLTSLSPLNKQIRTAVLDVVDAVIRGRFVRATRILSPTLTVKATRRHKTTARDTRRECVVTIGAPNYAERIAIERARMEREKFPLLGMLVKWEKKKK